MARDTAAPWAESVLMTADDLLALPDDGWRYELVDGRLVRMPPTGFEHGFIASRLPTVVNDFVDAHGLGLTTGAETGFLVSAPGEPDTVLAPDFAFISAARAPRPGTPDWTGFARLAPDLVVEIASPSQLPEDMAAKARRWLRDGVLLAWVVRPDRREVDVWLPGGDAPAETLGETDRLDGGDVLPGFSYPVARLWALYWD